MFWESIPIGKDDQEKVRFCYWLFKNFIVMLLKLMKEQFSQNIYLLRKLFFLVYI